MMCFNPKLLRSLNLTFFGLGPWAIIIHGIAKLANTFISQIRSLMTPFERSFSELSENHKIFDIASTEFKLIQVIAAERVPEPMIKLWRGNIFQQPLT